AYGEMYGPPTPTSAVPVPKARRSADFIVVYRRVAVFGESFPHRPASADGHEACDSRAIHHHERVGESCEPYQSGSHEASRRDSGRQGRIDVTTLTDRLSLLASITAPGAGAKPRASARRPRAGGDAPALPPSLRV